MASELVLIEQWRKRLKRQAESGMTVEAFCQKEGVSTSMFYRWQRQLQSRSSAAEALQPDGAAKTARKPQGKRSSRQRSEVSSAGEAASGQPPEFLRLPVRRVQSMPWIELTLADGHAKEL